MTGFKTSNSIYNSIPLEIIQDSFYNKRNGNRVSRHWVKRISQQDSIHLLNPTTPFKQTLTVMSYNILAPSLIVKNPGLYDSHIARKHAPRVLNWNVRSEKILKEIISMQPHVVCLQELDNGENSRFWRRLNSLGYDGCYYRRGSFLSEEDIKRKVANDKSWRAPIDGCAILWKKDMYIYGS
jgi:mRNA deadenylase 3'-5' endonuclease subunit Ccr4